MEVKFKLSHKLDNAFIHRVKSHSVLGGLFNENHNIHDGLYLSHASHMIHNVDDKFITIKLLDTSYGKIAKSLINSLYLIPIYSDFTYISKNNVSIIRFDLYYKLPKDILKYLRNRKIKRLLYDK